MSASAKVDPAFRQWACSFSGCDGGDPTAPVWLSGIEWGYAKGRRQTTEEYEAAISRYYIEELPEEMSEGRYVPEQKYDWKAQSAHPFGISVAKLFMAINGFSVEDYARVEDNCEDARLFKLNLYPIAFRYADDHLWKKYQLGDSTGLESKEAYRVWCFLNRFPSIAKEVEEHSPKLIVCAGISYLTDFFVCFAGTGGSENIHVGKLEPASSGTNGYRRYYWSRINSGKTVLAVVPFFSGRYGLNSNVLLKELGSQLAKLQS